MATLTSANWTWSYKTGDRRQSMMITDYSKAITGKLVLVSGNLTSTSKIKLPGFQSVGLVRRLDKYIIDNPILIASGSAGATVSGPMLVSYYVTGNQLKFNRVIKATGTGPGIIPLASTNIIASQTFYVTAVGW
jgi:hypothetical protein